MPWDTMEHEELESEVFDQSDWSAKLGVQSRHIGTGATRDEMQSISHNINLNVLREYRAAVGRETRRWALSHDFAELGKIINAEDARRSADKGDIGENAAWVESKWADVGWSHADCLYWLAIEHNWFHFGEMWVIRSIIENERL